MDKHMTGKRPRRQAVVVLGMHRSGTSAISGVLALLGATSPKSLMAPTDDNPRGYWESVEVMKANENVLSSAGSRWNDWGQFNPDWFGSAVAEEKRGDVVDLLEREYGAAPLILIKDPRMSRFLPLWLDALGDAGVDARAIIALRHPLAVARSLEVRDHFGRNRSMLLWLRHMLDAEAGSRELPRSFVSYDDVLTDWQAVARKVGTELGIAWPKRSDDTDLKISDFLTARLQHHKETDGAIAGDSELAEWVRQTYETMQRACDGPLEQVSLDNLDRIRREFNHSSALYGPVVREHEKRVEALYADVKAKLASSAELASGKGEMLTRAERKLSEAVSALAQQDAENQGLKQRLDAEEQSGKQQQKVEQQLRLNEAALRQATELATTEHARQLAQQREEIGKSEQTHRQAIERLAASEAVVQALRSDAKRYEAEVAAHSRQRREDADRYEAALAGHSRQQKEEAERHEATVAAHSLQMAKSNEELDKQNKRISELVAEGEVLSSGHGIALENLHRKVSDRDEQIKQLTELVAEAQVLASGQGVTLEQLHRKVSDRDAQIKQLAEELGQLKSVMEVQSMELHRALNAAETSAKIRFRETAKLTEMLFKSEVTAGEQATRAAELEKTQHGLKRQVATLQYANAFTRSMLSRETDQLRREAETYRVALNSIGSSLRWKLATLGRKVELPLLRAAESEADLESQLQLLRASALFDARWYVEQYPDAGASGMEPERHYLVSGVAAGHNPGPEFDSVAYLMEYPDVLEAVVNPLVHFLEHGQAESRVHVAVGNVRA